MVLSEYPPSSRSSAILRRNTVMVFSLFLVLSAHRPSTQQNEERCHNKAIKSPPPKKLPNATLNAGLNKGEIKNALARAVFFNRLGEMRDRSFEHQRYRASGLSLVVAAIILWNTVYLEKAIQTLKENGKVIDDTLLRNLSPLGWEHINMTGDYIWKSSKKTDRSKFRPLRPFQNA